MNCHICEGEITEENSRLLFYPDAGMEVRICDGCIEIKIKLIRVVVLIGLSLFQFGIFISSNSVEF